MILLHRYFMTRSSNKTFKSAFGSQRPWRSDFQVNRNIFWQYVNPHWKQRLEALGWHKPGSFQGQIQQLDRDKADLGKLLWALPKPSTGHLCEISKINLLKWISGVHKPICKARGICLSFEPPRGASPDGSTSFHFEKLSQYFRRCWVTAGTRSFS